MCVQSPEVFDLMIAGIVVSITNPSNSSSTRSSSSSSSSSSSTTCSPPFFENVIVQPAQWLSVLIRFRFIHNMSTHVSLLEVVLSISCNATLMMMCVCVSIRLDAILNTILLPVLLSTISEMSANASRHYQNKAVLLVSTAYIVLPL